MKSANIVCFALNNAKNSEKITKYTKHEIGERG